MVTSAKVVCTNASRDFPATAKFPCYRLSMHISALFAGEVSRSYRSFIQDERDVIAHPFSSISIGQITTSHQYAMISIILEIVWLTSLSPLLMKIAKYILLCMKLSDYCTISNLVHQASITYLGGFITTALMRLPKWLHIFWICPFPAALYLCSGDKR